MFEDRYLTIKYPLISNSKDLIETISNLNLKENNNNNKNKKRKKKLINTITPFLIE